MKRKLLLQKGDSIGIAAPAGPVNRRDFQRAVQNIRSSGFKPLYRRDIFSKNGYRAGSDQRRRRELVQMLRDPKISTLLFARGGYGTQSLLPLLQEVSPKIVVGMSDLTALLVWLWQRHHLPSYYGPLVGPHLKRRQVSQKLFRILTNPKALEKQKLKARSVIRPGKGRGRLVGGCLTLIASLLGTPFELKTDQTILFLEDTDEPPYAVDRLLTQLEQAGVFRKVRGIVFGTFRLGKQLFPISVEKVIREKFRYFQNPVLWGLQFGHCPNPDLIPLGGIGRIEKNRLVLERGIT